MYNSTGNEHQEKRKDEEDMKELSKVLREYHLQVASGNLPFSFDGMAEFISSKSNQASNILEKDPAYAVVDQVCSAFGPPALKECEYSQIDTILYNFMGWCSVRYLTDKNCGFSNEDKEMVDSVKGEIFVAFHKKRKENEAGQEELASFLHELYFPTTDGIKLSIKAAESLLAKYRIVKKEKT